MREGRLQMAAGLVNLPVGRLVSQSLPSPRLHSPHQCAGVPPELVLGPGARGLSSAAGLFSVPRACGWAAFLPSALGCVLLDLCVRCRLEARQRSLPRETPGPGSVLLEEGRQLQQPRGESQDEFAGCS